MALAQYYIGKANEMAEHAEIMRLYVKKHKWIKTSVVQFYQDRSAAYVTLAQQAAVRYGEVQP